MDVKLAATFIRVAELGNITRAAEQLGYSQASVSAHIQQLEEQLGVPLFDRIGRGIQLTDAGMRFRRYAVDLLKASEDADAFTLDRQNPSGMLYIGAGSSVSIGLLPRILPGFHDRYPDVRVSVNVTEDTDVLMDHLRQNRIDIAIPTDILSDYPGCVRAAERYEQFVFTAPAGDPIAKKKNVPLEEVFDRSYISVFISENKDNHFRYVLEPHLAARGIELQPAMEFGNNASIVRLLLQGTGRAFLPKFMIEDEVSTDRLAIIDTEHIDVQLYSQVFYSQNRWINPQIQAFLGYIRENL